MKSTEINLAKNKDLVTAMTALRRAAQRAREDAARTGTAVVVVRDQKLVRLEAELLRSK